MKIRFRVYATIWKIGEIFSIYYGPLLLLFFILSFILKSTLFYAATLIYFISFIRKLFVFSESSYLKCFRLSLNRKKNYQIQVTPSLKADIYFANQKEAPCLIFLYGGGFISGDISQHQDLSQYWSKGTYHIVYIDYPLAINGDYKNCFEKTLEAVEKLLSYSDPRFKPSSFSLGGRSAGGFLALQIASSNLGNKIENIIVFYPPVNIVNWLKLKTSKILLPIIDLKLFFKGTNLDELNITEDRLSRKIRYYFFLAENDLMVPTDDTFKLLNALKQKNFHFQVFNFKLCPHGFEANPFSLEGQRVCHQIFHIMNKINNT